MTQAPPQSLKRAVELLLPRHSREHILGDLEERYVSPAAYLRDAASAIPAAVLNQILKSTPLSFLALEALSVYTSIFAAWFLLQSLDGPPDPWRIASSTAVIMAGLLWLDVYGSEPGSWNSPAAQFIRRHRPSWAVPATIALSAYLAIYFSLALQWLCHGMLPNQKIFPNIMTTLTSIWVVAAVISSVRVFRHTRNQPPRGSNTAR